QEAGIEVLIPEEEDRQRVNYIIFQELCLGVLDDNSRQTLLAVIDKLAQQGAQGIVLGCTEIGLLVQQQDTDLPLFDTALIHAQKAALYSLDG
ncbi:MAG: aspartate/glutamate racemase family protein, partial [Syntrophomonadaceae bacterium]